MRGTLETIVGAMFAGKTSELLKRILWSKHQNKWKKYASHRSFRRERRRIWRYKY